MAAPSSDLFHTPLPPDEVVLETIGHVADSLARLRNDLTDASLSGGSAQDAFEMLVGLGDQLALAAGRCGTAAHDSGAHHAWGHTSAAKLAAHRTHTNPSHTHRITRRARAEELFTHFSEARQEQRITGEHLDPLLSIWDRHPSVRELLLRDEPELCRIARTLSPASFAKACQHWLALADPDTLDEQYHRRHEGRGLVWSRRLDGSLVFHGEADPVTGEIIADALTDRYNRLADADHQARTAARQRDEGVAVDGEPDLFDPTDPRCGRAHRTARQRRLDALADALLDSAATPTGAQRPEPLVQINLGESTIRDHVDAKLRDRLTLPALDAREPTDCGCTGTTDEPAARRDSPFELGDLGCDPTVGGAALASGHAIPTSVALANLIHGHLARVVCDTKGIVIDAGRTRRSFSKQQKKVLALTHSTCAFPGCHHPFRNCEIDHLLDWALGGETNLGNAAPLCRRHHRLKTLGFYTITRDQHGRLQFWRFDGTLLT